MITKKYCLDCNKELVASRYMKEVKRCKTCANKARDRYKQSDKAKESKRGSNNPQWKGSMVGYGALHRWVHRQKPKSDFCEHCFKDKPLDLANISGEYKRDVNDYQWLCRKCHTKLHYPDGRWGRNREEF